MNILGIIGSPRASGSSSILVRKVLEGAREKGAIIETAFLDKLEINHCKGCLVCQKEGECAQKDDMLELLEKMKAADIIVVGTPVYWGDVSAQVKSWMDRSFSFVKVGNNSCISPLKGKQAVLIACCASSDITMNNHALNTLEIYFTFHGMKIRGKLEVSGAGGEGDILSNKEKIEEAYKLGSSLV
jgi:multimeric flavodoxin WrbA